MVDSIIADGRKRMQKSLEKLCEVFSRMRAGRASPALLECVKVNCYDSEMPLNQVASVSVQDARSLMVTAWDRSLVQSIDKAIRNAELGLNPVVAGESIRVPLPPMTEERRKEMIKMARAEGELARVAVRNVRRDAKQSLKDMVKDKGISEDDKSRAEDRLQKATDEFIAKIEETVSQKEREIIEI